MLSPPLSGNRNEQQKGEVLSPFLPDLAAPDRRRRDPDRLSRGSDAAFALHLSNT